MAPTIAMVNFAIKLKPKFVCIVPENRREITTEGGLNLSQKNLRILINKLKKNNIEVSLFINPSIKDIRKSDKLGADAIEIHTGSFAKSIKAKNKNKKIYEFNKIKKCKLECDKTKMKFNLGHGLDYQSIKYLNKIKNINEYNIGHFIIGESLFDGFPKVIKKFKRLIR